MSVKRPDKIENFDQLNKFIDDLYSNIGVDDLRPSNIRTVVPTTDTLDLGRLAIFDDGTTRRIYYRALSGTITSATLS